MVGVKRTGGMLLLAMVMAGGCRHYVQPPLINSTWFDYSLYQRPALYFDHKSHYPSSRQHIQHYLWQHPSNHSALAGAAWLPQQPYVQASFAPLPAETQSATPTQYEQAPYPQIAPQNPIQIELPGELQPPYSPPLLTPPPAPVPREQTGSESQVESLPATGPTAHNSTQYAPGIQQVGWQNRTPQLPGPNMLFPR